MSIWRLAPVSEKLMSESLCERSLTNAVMAYSRIGRTDNQMVLMELLLLNLMQICNLKEFQSKAEHYYPYEK